MLAAKDWFRLKRKTDGRSLAWIPEPVKLDTHDEERLNRIFVLPDHTLVIRNFQPSTFYSPINMFSFSVHARTRTVYVYHTVCSEINVSMTHECSYA